MLLLKINFFLKRNLYGIRKDYIKNINYWPKCMHCLTGAPENPNNCYAKNRLYNHHN